MRETRLIERAKALAREKHGGHLRKYTGVPYWTHTEAVAELVATVTDDERIIAAALLHDTLEDTNTSYGELITLFGVGVATLVYQVTNASMLCPDADRVIKAAIDREFLSLACPAAKTIKLADVIDNTKSIRAYDPAFAKVYIAEKRALLGVLKAGDPTLWKMAHANVHKEG